MSLILIDQNRFRYRVIPWVNVYPELRYHMANLGHNRLIDCRACSAYDTQYRFVSYHNVATEQVAELLLKYNIIFESEKLISSQSITYIEIVSILIIQLAKTRQHWAEPRGMGFGLLISRHTWPKWPSIIEMNIVFFYRYSSINLKIVNSITLHLDKNNPSNLLDAYWFDIDDM